MMSSYILQCHKAPPNPSPKNEFIKKKKKTFIFIVWKTIKCLPFCLIAYIAYMERKKKIEGEKKIDGGKTGVGKSCASTNKRDHMSYAPLRNTSGSQVKTKKHNFKFNKFLSLLHGELTSFLRHPMCYGKGHTHFVTPGLS